MNVLLILGVLGALCVAALAIYALSLWRNIWRRDREQVALKNAARSDQTYSLRTLAKSMLDGELNISEAAIRLKVLLDHLQSDGSGAHQYPDIYALYNAVADMPRGAARDGHAAADIKALDAQREAIEARYRDAVLAQGRLLLQAYSRA